MKILRTYSLSLVFFLPAFMVTAQAPDSSNVPYFSILAPQSIAGLYEGGANGMQQYGQPTFGLGVSNGNIVGEVVMPAEDTLYCTPGSEDFTGKIVLIPRGSCTFSQKVFNAEQRGAAGVILWNFEDVYINMAFGGPDTPTIACIMVPHSLGQLIYNQLQQQQTVVAAFSKEPLNYALIKGRVLADANANCQPEGGEPGLKNWIISAQGTDKTYAGLTNSAGEYRLYVDTINSPYLLSASPPNTLWAACNSEQTPVLGSQDTFLLDFAAAALMDCPQLTTDISVNVLRRCFESYFKVQVCNEGSVTAENAYVDITLDWPGFEQISSSSEPFTLITPGVYRFELDDLAVGVCQEFTFVATVSCDSTILGQTICYTAHAYPDTVCAVLPNWSGATVSVLGECLGDSVQFRITNSGSAPMSQPSSYIIIEDDVMVSSGEIQLDPNSFQLVSLPANGATYRIEAAQEPNHPVPGVPATTVEGCVNGGGAFSTGFYLMFPVYDSSPSEDHECGEVVGSWDPNDKTGYPLGFGPEHFIRPETELEYVIRFQNTGTDTAFNIVVRDTLSAGLNPATFRAGNSSHPYTLSILDENRLVFHFDNILLPDSFVNEPASHGYLTYKISQTAGNPLGTVIENRAAIYFDFNLPVLTNTTRHEIGDLPHLSLSSHAAAHLTEPTSLQIQPNPASVTDILKLAEPISDGAHWRLIDSSGRIRASGQIQNQQIIHSGSELKPGAYWLEVRDQRSGLYRFGQAILH